MNPYELFWIVSKQDATEQKDGMILGVMTSETTCKIGENQYEEEDIFIPNYLKEPICTKVLIVDGEDRSTYIKPLKKGDKVLLYPLTETEFIVIGRI